MLERRVYVSGPLTVGGTDEIERLKQFYEAIAAVCRGQGYATYVPHQHTDPISHSSILPRNVYEIDMRQVSRADLVLAYVGRASHGVGAEIERAYHTGTKVVLLYEQGTKVSRLIRGCPAVSTEIEFVGQEDALKQVDLLLGRWQELEN